jgi:hypothetical protein
MRMKRIRVVFFAYVVTMSVLVSISWAGSVTPSKDGKLDGGEFGVIYECSFPNTVKLDGDLNELPWQYAPHLPLSRTANGCM